MLTNQTVRSSEVIDGEWITFQGGELEGRRPKALCPTCRETLRWRATLKGPPSDALRGRAALSGSPRGARTLCFQCYRADLARERALIAAGQLDTASTARFQFALPFEPVDLSRLKRLSAERADARAAMQTGAGRFGDKRRRAQIAARHALQGIAEGLRARGTGSIARATPEHERRREQNRAMASAIHAAELQLPASWLAFVMTR